MTFSTQNITTTELTKTQAIGYFHLKPNVFTAESIRYINWHGVLKVVNRQTINLKGHCALNTNRTGLGTACWPTVPVLTYRPTWRDILYTLYVKSVGSKCHRSWTKAKSISRVGRSTPSVCVSQTFLNPLSPPVRTFSTCDSAKISTVLCSTVQSALHISLFPS